VRRVAPCVADAGAIPQGVADVGTVRPQGLQSIGEHLMGRTALFESVRTHWLLIFPLESESEDVIVTGFSFTRPDA
jgi:hypothetical protein